ncbi:MAG: flagellar biosynthesis protein FlhB [Oscillospiraceae bacterium]|jgi:flagellar biosynthetic protein FlhB|nr:flagellar biosynthesis protein FlhB [Oscillospiraceae bacterium]
MSQSGGEKTEKASAKKRKDAKEKGQVLKSSEVNIAVCTTVIFAVLLVMWPRMTEQFAGIFTDFLEPSYVSGMSEELDAQSLSQLFINVLMKMGTILMPVLLCAFLSGIVSNVLQTGFIFTTKTLSPKLERISPLKGFKRIFSAQTVMQLVKSILKVVVLGYILVSEYQKLFPKFPSLVGTNIYTSFLEMMRVAFTIALKMCLAMSAIAAGDFIFQWWKYEKDLMMTKQEVRDEYKLTEGDPQIKSRIRQKQRQMSAMRMMSRVPDADVVITNPTHFAVALRYEDGRSGAPVVVAKGQDFIARKIKEKAREHGIEIVENKPLAQSLYKMCDIDDEIPPDFYQAVADILVYVYKRKKSRYRISS